MFTTSKKLMIAAATLIPLAFVGPTDASAFGLGGFGHMAPMSRAGGGMGGGGFAHMGAMNRGPMGGGFSNHVTGGLGHSTVGMRTSGHTMAARPVTNLGGTHAGSSAAHTSVQRPVANNTATTARSHTTSTATNKPTYTSRPVTAANSKLADNRPAAVNKPADTPKNSANTVEKSSDTPRGSISNVPDNADKGGGDTPPRTTEHRLVTGLPLFPRHEPLTPGGQSYTPIADSWKLSCCYLEIGPVVEGDKNGTIMAMCKKRTAGFCSKASCTLSVNGSAQDEHMVVYQSTNTYACTTN
jgi:hypothetical protein